MHEFISDYFADLFAKGDDRPDTVSKLVRKRISSDDGRDLVADFINEEF